VRESGPENFLPFFGTAGSEYGPVHGLLYATALMFVAYTGYGRIATLGEEVREPRRTIPRAIVLTLVVSAALYIVVGVVAVGSVGADALAEATEGEAAPLEVVARGFTMPSVHLAVAVGAMAAMLGVLLNLILGLSRVLLAMGRRGDMPSGVARLNTSRTTPYVATMVVGLAVAGLAASGSVKTTWTFSAFTVLVYYAITNLAALRLGEGDRLYPRVFAWGGLGACLFLVFWVEWRIWAVGLGLIAIGLAWHKIWQRQPRTS
jgi:APA family basic amino acid/polyamine antiporter